MKIFKFGGASVSTAEAVKQLADIVAGSEPPLIVVVSAMGKTTNALEAIVDHYFRTETENGITPLEIDPQLKARLEQIREQHTSIAEQLFTNPRHPVFQHIKGYFTALEEKLRQEASLNYDFEYDQIVVYGELLATRIVAAYLEERGLPAHWKDVRKIIKTDSTYRNARVNWELTTQQVNRHLREETGFTVLQGFIAASPNNISTTLGREGSDFTASILGYQLQAEEVVIWKDVAGVFNADPKLFSDAVKLDEISFREAVELAYYGAKVIHPKTIKPLQNRQIPLKVNSFMQPAHTGTLVAHFNNQLVCRSENATPPVYIIKKRQMLISVSPQDFSFIVEANLSKIFGLLAQYNLQVNLMQHSAISFSICLDEQREKIDALLAELQQDFRVLYNTGLTLITIRHYTDAAIERMISGKTIYVEQKSRNTARYVTAPQRNIK